MSNPYDDLAMVIEGEIDSVANWIDEHVLAGHAALAAGLGGACEYEQGHFKDTLVSWLNSGGVFEPPVSGYSGVLLATPLP